MGARLDPTERDTALARLADWQLVDGGKAIHRNFAFADFTQAFAFMTRVALAAEKADHHPDWSNSYRTVSITLSTHSAGGLTAKDFALAARIDEFAAG